MENKKRKSEAEVDYNTKSTSVKRQKTNRQPQRLEWKFTNFKLDTIFNEEKMVYMSYQLEKCPTTGNLHHQGFAIFKRKITPAGFQKIGSKSQEKFNCKILGANQTRQNAREYTQKKDTRVEGPWEFGEWPGETPGQGARTDIKEFIKDVKEGATTLDLITNHAETWTKYPKLADRINAAIYENIQKPPPFVWILCGESGKGKSYIAQTIGDYIGSYYKKVGNPKWWPGYKNQIACCIDDIEKGMFQEKELLHMTDRYKYFIEAKNIEMWLTSPIIFFTCNNLNWCNFEGMKRRINVLSLL